MKNGERLGRRWLYIAVPAAAVVLVAAGILVGRMAAQASSQPPAQAAVSDAPGTGLNRIGYDANVVVDDPETLQQAVDEMYAQAQEPGVTLEFKEVAVSDDGKNFACYIGNAAENAYDMFIAIYADQALTDELYLSGLMRPGTRFEQIELERTLEPGEYTAYVVYTQVKDEEEEEIQVQKIQAQVASAITLIVNG